MKAKIIKEKPGTDREKLLQMDDNKVDYSDSPELDDSFFENATIRLPEPKKL